MISLIIGIMVSLVVTIVGTPLLIKLVHKLNYGQYIRQDGPKSHLVKRGTPTLGGVVINLAGGARLVLLGTVSVPHQGRGAVVVRGVGAVRMLSMGFWDFIDDFAKSARSRARD